MPEENGFVYFAVHELGPVKIGKSIDPLKRVPKVGIELPFNLTLMARKRPKNESARALEGRIHQRLSEYRMNGEWFDLSPENVKWAIWGTKGYEPTIYSHPDAYTDVFERDLSEIRVHNESFSELIEK